MDLPVKFDHVCIYSPCIAHLASHVLRDPELTTLSPCHLVFNYLYRSMGNECWSFSSSIICPQRLFFSEKFDEVCVLSHGVIRYIIAIIISLVLSSLNQTRDATVHLHFDHPLPESNCRQYHSLYITRPVI